MQVLFMFYADLHILKVFCYTKLIRGIVPGKSGLLASMQILSLLGKQPTNVYGATSQSIDFV